MAQGGKENFELIPSDEFLLHFWIYFVLISKKSFMFVEGLVRKEGVNLLISTLHACKLMEYNQVLFCFVFPSCIDENPSLLNSLGVFYRGSGGVL